MDKTKNVDYDIEQFWFGFKTSMINFYKTQNISRRHSSLGVII